MPRLEQNRLQVERVFRQVFYPEDGLQTLKEQSLHTQGNREDSVFNISLGYSLKQEPVIGTALKVLAIALEREEFANHPAIARTGRKCRKPELLITARRARRATKSEYD